MFPTKFRRLNNEKRTLGVIVDDLSRQLFIAAVVFELRARERAVKSGETAFFANIYLLQRCLQNRRGKNQEYPHKFLLVQLRSTESGWNNVGKLEIVFRRAWLMVVALPNWIIS